MSEERRNEVIALSIDTVLSFASATPPGAVVAALAQAIHNRESRKWQNFMNELCASFGDELEMLGSRLSDVRVQELVHHGLRRAADTDRDEQIALLARIVADGTWSGEAGMIDRAHLLLDMAAGLEPAHVEVLKWAAPQRVASARELGPRGGEYSTSTVENGLPHLKGIAGAVLSVLVARGLVERIDVEMDPRSKAVTQRHEPVWKVTTFGHDVLNALRQVRPDPAG